MKSTTRSNRVVFWEVDTQADFMLPGGKLYVPGAEKRIAQMKRLVAAVRAGKVFLVSSADQHAQDDPEFQRFPAHCVRGTSAQRFCRNSQPRYSCGFRMRRNLLFPATSMIFSRP